MRILAFAASLRSESLNRRLLLLAAAIARGEGVDVDVAEFRDFEMPMYDGEMDARSGLPPGAVELKRRVEAADAIMIATPEYNYSIPGTLKNAIDWVSRGRPMPWRGKSVFLMSASPSVLGGVRGLVHARVPLEGCGALVFPDMYSLPTAHQAFDASGGLVDAKARERLERQVVSFVQLAVAVTPVCTLHAAGTIRPKPEAIAAGLEEQTELQDGSRARA